MFKGQKIYSVSCRIYLDIKFEDHVRAKSYKCLWDSRIHQWYFHEDDYVKSGIKRDTLLHNELSPYMIIDNVIHFV